MRNISKTFPNEEYSVFRTKKIAFVILCTNFTFKMLYTEIGGGDMQQLLPIIIICSAGLAACVGILIYFFVKFLMKKFKKKTETFDMDETTLTINLNSKNTHK